MRKSTPTTLQMQAADCGAASVKMCLDSLGCIFTLDEVRDLISVGRDGSSVGDIVKGVQSFGVEVSYAKVPYDQLDTVAPCILWWNKNHFLVYEGSQNGKYYLNDPAQGKRTISKKEIESQFSGIYVKLEKVPEELSGYKSENVISIIGLFKSFTSIVQTPLFLGIALGLSAAIPTIFTAQITSYFIDAVLINKNLAVGINLLWVLFFLCGLTVLISYVTFSIYSRATFVSTNLKSFAFARRILELPHKWFINRVPEEIATRFEIPSQLTDSVSYDATELIATIGKSVIISLTIFFISPPIGIFIIILVLFLSYISNFVKNKTDVVNKKQAMYEGVAQGVSISTLTELHQLRVLSMESNRFSMWAGYYTNMINASQTISFYENVLGLFTNSSYYLLNTFLLVAGPILITKNMMTLGNYIAIQYLLAMVNVGIRSLPGLVGEYQAITSPTERLRDIFEQPNQLPPIRSSKTLDYLDTSIELANISFGYDSHNTVLSNINFSEPLNDGVVITSEPSAGKSTLLLLLSGLLKPSNGAIYFESNKTKILPESIKITYISSPRIFIEGNLIDNITFKDPEIKQEDALTAAKVCGIDIPSSLQDLPVYKHGGGQLSMTEKNRIVLARVLCSKDPLILIDDFDLDVNKDTLLYIFNKLKSNGQKIIFTTNNIPNFLSTFNFSTIDLS
jgi:ABC-type bacteriocin/lantibiotic exporter with double-glycine peptidase domain